MKTKFIAIVTAGAIAFTGITAPAAQAADNGEIARFLLGVGLVAAIANSANGTVVTTTNRTHTHAGHNHTPPKQCLRQRRVNHVWKKYYSHRCLARLGYRGPHRHW